MLAHGDQAVVQLRRIRHVKIARQREIARRPGTPPKVGMTRAHAVPPRGAVAEMPHQQFAAKIKVLLYRLSELRMDNARITLIVIGSKEGFEDSVERVRFHAALAKHVRFTRRHIELYAGDTRAVLTTVVLLLHQQEKLGKTPE